MILLCACRNPAVVTSNDILSVLRPYCSDPLRPLPIRKKLFVLIEKVQLLQEKDSLNLSTLKCYFVQGDLYTVKVSVSWLEMFHCIVLLYGFNDLLFSVL